MALNPVKAVVQTNSFFLFFLSGIKHIFYCALMFLFCPPILRPAQQYTKGRSLELTNTSKYQVGIQVQLLENWGEILQHWAKFIYY